MRVEQAQIRNFRNHTKTDIECSLGINAVLGDNGEGKTNIVEALSYLCLTKSFYAANDAVVLQIGANRFSLRGMFVGDSGAKWLVGAEYEKEYGQKKISINKEPVQSLVSVVGQFPVVILSPEQHGITFGPPTERRKFLDLAISQASKVYLEDLLEYRKVLRQRNKLLLDQKLLRRDLSDEMEPWTASLIRTGSRLMKRRADFVDLFQPFVREYYRSVTGGKEEAGVAYVPSFAGGPFSSQEALARSFEDELRSREDEERRMGTTAVGPHRDEIDLVIDGLHLRKYASQGQHKTYLVALKLAEFFLLKKQINETPILLLDDVFSELDDRRSHRLLKLVENVGQVFITTTDNKIFPRTFKWTGNHRKYKVRQGNVLNDSKREKTNKVNRGSA